MVTHQELIEFVYAGLKKAYAPYAQTKVGAAIVTVRDEIFVGCNIENAPVGITCCAERVALYYAYYKPLSAIKKVVEK